MYPSLSPRRRLQRQKRKKGVPRRRGDSLFFTRLSDRAFLTRDNYLNMRVRLREMVFRGTRQAKLMGQMCHTIQNSLAMREVRLLLPRPFLVPQFILGRDHFTLS